MKVITLMDDQSKDTNFFSEHGLCLYLEVNNKKILFDTGKTGLFIKNARRLGVTLETVEMVILSHGHYDHGGGLKDFLKINQKAKIYVVAGAFDPRYALRENGDQAYIGLDPSLKGHNQIIEVHGELQISEGICLFSGVESPYPKPMANGNLFAVSDLDGTLVPDHFNHEQNLVITEDESKYLLAGCAHNGICNILEYVVKHYGASPDFILGGFHLNNRQEALCPSLDQVDEIGYYLLARGGTYYTGHCTGETAYKRLKKLMGDKVHYLFSGSQINL